MFDTTRQLVRRDRDTIGVPSARMAHGAYLSLERNLAEEWLSKKGHIECECGLVLPSYIAFCQHKVQ